MKSRRDWSPKWSSNKLWSCRSQWFIQRIVKSSLMLRESVKRSKNKVQIFYATQFWVHPNFRMRWHEESSIFVLKTSLLSRRWLVNCALSTLLLYFKETMHRFWSYISRRNILEHSMIPNSKKESSYLSLLLPPKKYKKFQGQDSKLIWSWKF